MEPRGIGASMSTPAPKLDQRRLRPSHREHILVHAADEATLAAVLAGGCLVIVRVFVLGRRQVLRAMLRARSVGRALLNEVMEQVPVGGCRLRQERTAYQ